MELLVCPVCLGIFRTFYQEDKQERCPYCTQVVNHSPSLLELAHTIQCQNTSAADIFRSISASLELISARCKEQVDPGLADLDQLISRLDLTCRKAVELRRRIPDKGAENNAERITSDGENKA